ncbi:TetR/AcrR family transcriptional regulator [Nocardioides antri]|uniref:TetR/AcrR family transcriptional regulator n=1 Tax=Nocardioides antri TaxID=2607659 RepID=A0A5B1M470_9ACTN|nr:TetR/AcrR family transcriptional regulator [Nocardioides antri]KAA1427732.1 TetR/AcrR family transcriptional regulator [Nocardioides antri]
MRPGDELIGLLEVIMATSGPECGPRDRLLLSAVTLVRRQGVAGTGLAELLERSRTARGSVYQHFPGGKEELVAASTRLAGDAVAQRIRAEAHHIDPVEIVRAVVDTAIRDLVDHGFEFGCPIAAAASSGPDHAEAVAAAADSFAAWVSGLRDGFASGGMDRSVAEAFASVVVSAVEGAILQARASRSLDPLLHVAEQLSDLARTRPRATD